jgi:predicted phosphodiesterase
MKKIKSLAWATDTHFELASDKQFKKFLESVKDVDALIITGDIAQATSWQHYLYKVAKKLNPIPVYFILGNHDIYHSDIDTEADKLYSISIPNLHPLSICPPIQLNKNTVLIGHQNWWDGGYSMEETNFIDRTFMFQDYLLIKDLTGLEKPNARFDKLRILSEKSTEQIIEQCKLAFETADNILLAVHVPPFKQNCTYFGLPMTNNFLSHFSSRILGDALYFLMRDKIKKNMVVLSGHTHESTEYSPLPNLISKTGKANILKPRAHKILNIKDLF